MRTHSWVLSIALFALLGCGDDDGGTTPDGGGGDRDGGGGRDDGGGTRDDGGSGDDAGGGGRDAGPLPSVSCRDALPAPTGPTIMVTPAMADELPSIVASAASGTTILLADGTYRIGPDGESARRIQFRNPNVTLR